MIRTFRIGSVEKNDYTQTDASGEAISEISTSFLLSYEIDALRSQIYTAQMGM